MASPWRGLISSSFYILPQFLVAPFHFPFGICAVSWIPLDVFSEGTFCFGVLWAQFLLCLQPHRSSNIRPELPVEGGGVLLLNVVTQMPFVTGFTFPIEEGPYSFPLDKSIKRNSRVLLKASKGVVQNFSIKRCQRISCHCYRRRCSVSVKNLLHIPLKLKVGRCTKAHCEFISSFQHTQSQGPGCGSCSKQASFPIDQDLWTVLSCLTQHGILWVVFSP